MANPPGKVTDPQADDAAAKNNNALWYTFQGIGRAYLIRRGSVAAGDADVASVHGYSTIEQAVTNANTVGAATQTLITQWDTDASLPVGGGTLGVVETVNITWNGKTATSSTQQNPTTAAASQNTGISAITGFLGGLTSKNLWVRVGKVLIGGILLIIGLAKMTGFEKGVVGKAVKAAPLL